MYIIYMQVLMIKHLVYLLFIRIYETIFKRKID